MSMFGRIATMATIVAGLLVCISACDSGPVEDERKAAPSTAVHAADSGDSAVRGSARSEPIGEGVRFTWSRQFPGGEFEVTDLLASGESPDGAKVRVELRSERYSPQSFDLVGSAAWDVENPAVLVSGQQFDALVVTTYSGGSSCCWETVVFDLRSASKSAGFDSTSDPEIVVKNDPGCPVEMKSISYLEAVKNERAPTRRYCLAPDLSWRVTD